MNTITNSSVNKFTSKPTHRLLALTALAAACSILSVPALAETAIASAATVESTVPTAVDSSKRVVRRVSTGVSATPTATTENEDTPIQTTISVEPSFDVAVNVSQVGSSKNLPIVNAYKPGSTPAIVAGSTYQPAPNANTSVGGGQDISRGQLGNIPVPQAQISNASFVPTIIIAQKRNSDNEKLDVSLLDDFIKDTSPNARHYPPNFPNRTQRHTAREKIKVLTDWIEPYASASDASFDVLVRAAKLNGMGRNLDLGSDYTVRGGKYIDRAVKINPNSEEANFIYGMMLSEGGGFKEGQKYLDRAVTLGSVEAEQSLAQSDLLSDRRSQALDRLRRLEQKMPDNTMIRQQIQIVEDGKYYIWDLPTTSN